MSKTSLTCQGPELDVIGPPLQFWDELSQVDLGGVS